MHVTTSERRCRESPFYSGIMPYLAEWSSLYPITSGFDSFSRILHAKIFVLGLISASSIILSEPASRSGEDKGM
jgi:hypothetical protein